MKSYNTEQRAMLTGFLKDNNESALSAEEIAEGLKEKALFTVFFPAFAKRAA